MRPRVHPLWFEACFFIVFTVSELRMKKRSTIIAGIFLACAGAYAQPSRPAALNVQFTLTTSRDTGTISRYVYGSNGHSDDRDENVTARRFGGNRLTGYNWENNASNAGDDHVHHSDNYLTRFLPGEVQNVPGIAYSDFHDSSLATSAYSLLTLPAAGYVARDKNGTVTEVQTAPSSRWAEVRFAKHAPFTTQPDLNDPYVYVDESVNMLVQKYGNASATHGVRGYAVDNEPALWPSTHPRIHPEKPTCAEVIEKSIAMATAVKAVDPHAEMFGPVLYGFSAYVNFQEAPDWNQYQQYGWFLDAYLAKMKEAEQTEGKRLLDVLDVHWYPEAQGQADNGAKIRVALSGNSDRGVAIARMQAPRTLWDSTYREDSWIGEWFSPVSLIPHVQSIINRRYPGTKLAFTEFNYGGEQHISGGIAMADVLGIFGRYGIYMSNYWGEIESYISSAYRIYRNYDGHHSTFGDRRIGASTSDLDNSSVHASLDDHGRLHIIVINKNYDQPIEGRFALPNGTRFRQGTVYGFDAASPDIREMGTIASIPGSGEFIHTVAPLTVQHIVLLPDVAGGVELADNVAGAVSCQGIGPNPFSTETAVLYTIPARAHVRLSLADPLGREVAVIANGDVDAGSHIARVDGRALAPGVYYFRAEAAGRITGLPLMLVR